jgi:hypothetical protein
MLKENGGIETPAFGKKKIPSLAYFKGEADELESIEKKKKKKIDNSYNKNRNTSPKMNAT